MSSAFKFESPVTRLLFKLGNHPSLSLQVSPSLVIAFLFETVHRSLIKVLNPFASHNSGLLFLE